MRWSCTFSSFSVNLSQFSLLITCATPITSPEESLIGMHSNAFVLYPVCKSISRLKRSSCKIIRISENSRQKFEGKLYIDVYLICVGYINLFSAFSNMTGDSRAPCNANLFMLHYFFQCTSRTNIK